MQKKWLIFVLLLLLAIPAQAQWFIGGKVGFDANFKEKTGGFSLRPDVGYTFKNNIAVGVNGIFAYDTFFLPEVEKWESSIRYGLIPYIQYYFIHIGKFSFYLDGGMEFSHFSSPSVSYWRFIPYISPGLEIVLTDHWSLLGTLGRLEYNSYLQSLLFSVDGSNFSVGLYYNF